jgi:hypothetical protein
MFRMNARANTGISVSTHKKTSVVSTTTKPTKNNNSKALYDMKKSNVSNVSNPYTNGVTYKRRKRTKKPKKVVNKTVVNSSDEESDSDEDNTSQRYYNPPKSSLMNNELSKLKHTQNINSDHDTSGDEMDNKHNKHNKHNTALNPSDSDVDDESDT